MKVGTSHLFKITLLNLYSVCAYSGDNNKKMKLLKKETEFEEIHAVFRPSYGYISRKKNIIPLS